MSTPETRPDESDAQRETRMEAALRKWVGRGLLIFCAALVFGSYSLYNFVRARSTCSGSHPCPANLMKIQGAKENWALEERRRPQDIPSVTNLCGPTGYIARPPVCPSGGIYTYGRVDQKPTCSFPGHSLK